MRTAYDSENKQFLIKDTTKDFSTKQGTLKKEDLSQSTADTNTGKQYTLFDADFLDKWKKLKRGAQIFLPKDIGSIIINTGMGKNSVVAEAGGGSGKGTTFFAHIAKQVHSFEIKPDHCNVLKQNIDFLEQNNVTLYEQNVLDQLPNIKVDIFILDLLDTVKAMNHIHSIIKTGGYVVTYNPHMTQVSAIMNDDQVKEKYIHHKTIEIIEREWLVKDKQARPKFEQLVHSGFLSFFRRK